MNKSVTVKANLKYGPHGKHATPLRIDIICDASNSTIWENATIKEVEHDRFFIDNIGPGNPVLNENQNKGVSFSRFITNERGCKPVDGNPLNVTTSNWKHPIPI